MAEVLHKHFLKKVFLLLDGEVFPLLDLCELLAKASFVSSKVKLVMSTALSFPLSNLASRQVVKRLTLDCLNHTSAYNMIDCSNYDTNLHVRAIIGHLAKEKLASYFPYMHGYTLI